MLMCNTDILLYPPADLNVSHSMSEPQLLQGLDDFTTSRDLYQKQAASADVKASLQTGNPYLKKKNNYVFNPQWMDKIQYLSWKALFSCVIAIVFSFVLLLHYISLQFFQYIQYINISVFPFLPVI